MLTFEAINLGVMYLEKRYVKELTAKYADHRIELFQEILKVHPEYFVDGEILKQFTVLNESDLGDKDYVIEVNLPVA